MNKQRNNKSPAKQTVDIPQNMAKHGTNQTHPPGSSKSINLFIKIFTIVVPSIMAVVGCVDYFYGSPGLYAYWAKTRVINSLEKAATGNDSANLIILLKSIDGKNNFIDEYNYYSGLLRVKYPQSWPEGPRNYFETIKRGSPYFDKSINQHFKYIQNIINHSNKIKEIEYFQKSRLLENKRHEYYFICELEKLISYDQSSNIVIFDSNYKKWESILIAFREAFSDSIYFNHFPFRYGYTKTGDKTFQTQPTPGLIMHVTTTEFLLQLGLFQSSTFQTKQVREDHLLRLKTMLNHKASDKNLVWFKSDSPRGSTETSWGSMIDLNDCLKNYDLFYTTIVANKLLL